jgi:hypothetical protein
MKRRADPEDPTLRMRLLPPPRGGRHRDANDGVDPSQVPQQIPSAEDRSGQELDVQGDALRGIRAQT